MDNRLLKLQHKIRPVALSLVFSGHPIFDGDDIISEANVIAIELLNRGCFSKKALRFKLIDRLRQVKGRVKKAGKYIGRNYKEQVLYDDMPNKNPKKEPFSEEDLEMHDLSRKMKIVLKILEKPEYSKQEKDCLHYSFMGNNQRKISKILNYTECRIGQLKRQVLRKLQEDLKE